MPSQSSPRTTCDVPCADVLRTTRPIGLDALHRLRRLRVPLGPVASTAPRQAVEFAVAAGTERSWPTPPHTDAHALCEAVAAALAHRGLAWLSEPRAAA